MTYRFGQFELDPDRVELRAGSDVIHLEPKNFELLELLVRNNDRLLTKDEIFDQIWPGVFVTEASLSGAIKNIRKALGDDGTSQSTIKTVRGRGFRFIADVGQVPAAQPQSDQVKLETPTQRENGPPVLAILPFENLDYDPSQSAIAEAIPTELIAALSKLNAFRILARGSSFRLDTKTHSLADIRSRLHAGYVVTGTVSQTGQTLSVVVDLTDTASELVIWSETYQSRIDDLFSIKEDIVRSVVNAVEYRVPHQEAERLLKVPSENLDAWGNYHLGVRHLYRFNAPDNTIAARYFERAVAQDPNFARAIAGLSYTEFENYNLGFGSDKLKHFHNTKEHAEKAVDLDPYDPFCNLVLARANWLQSELDSAISWADRSIQLNPNYAFALYNAGKFNAIDCTPELAHSNLKNAMSLSPIDPHLQSMLSARAVAAFTQDDAEQAKHFASLSLRAPNAHLYVCIFAAAILSSYGEITKAQAAQRRIKALGGALDREHFLSLFTLSNASRSRDLMHAIDRLSF